VAIDEGERAALAIARRPVGILQAQRFEREIAVRS